MISKPDYSLPAPLLARALIGAALTVDGAGGLIVETEAYAIEDAASHSFKGQTARNAAMFGPVGRAYVYRSHGLHWCLNVVCGEPGSAVLIRAVEPVWGVADMMERRGMEDVRGLCSGPGKLCQAMEVSIAHNGLALDEAPFSLVLGEAVDVVTGPRIGITKNADAPLRFGLRGSRFWSRGFPSSPV